jgi:trans-aconitate 2-methyltransferase
VPQRPYREIYDLGCGTGELTQHLSDRFPEARVVGIDISPQMLASSGTYVRPGRLAFEQADIADFDRQADLLFSNAALQWLRDHERLVPRLASLLKPAGVLAVQMPNNFDEPSHRLLEETARNGPWARRLSAWRNFEVWPLERYVDLLLGLGLEVDAWETTYYFVLQGADPVLEWVKGTSLQPVLALLDGDDERHAFLEEYKSRLASAYPSHDYGTVYPFRRCFFVASRA